MEAQQSGEAEQIRKAKALVETEQKLQAILKKMLAVSDLELTLLEELGIQIEPQRDEITLVAKQVDQMVADVNGLSQQLEHVDSAPLIYIAGDGGGSF